MSFGRQRIGGASPVMAAGNSGWSDLTQPWYGTLGPGVPKGWGELISLGLPAKTRPFSLNTSAYSPDRRLGLFEFSPAAPLSYRIRPEPIGL